MSDISRPSSPADMPEYEKLFENLPVEIHVGQHPRHPETVIGYAYAFKNKDDGTVSITMELHEEGAKKLLDLNEMFKLFSIGFAGVKRRPQ